jgi:hypothetical protein
LSAGSLITAGSSFPKDLLLRDGIPSLQEQHDRRQPVPDPLLIKQCFGSHLQTSTDAQIEKFHSSVRRACVRMSGERLSTIFINNTQNDFKIKNVSMNVPNYSSLKGDPLSLISISQKRTEMIVTIQIESLPNNSGKVVHAGDRIHSLLCG